MCVIPGRGHMHLKTSTSFALCVFHYQRRAACATLFIAQVALKMLFRLE